MSPKANEDPRNKRELLEEIGQLRTRLDEAEQTLDAIRSGDVDALVVAGPHGDQIYSLTGSERTYRLIVETMNEAALTVGLDGTVLFCNQRFADLAVTPMADAIGKKLTTFVAPAQQRSLRMLLADTLDGPAQQHIMLQAADGTAVSVLVAANMLKADESTSICLVMSDLTELEAQASSIQHLRRQQQALEEIRVELEAANNSLSDSRLAALNVAEDALIARRLAEEASAELQNEVFEHKQAEVALKESEERFRALTMASSDSIYRMSSDWSEMFHLDGRDFIADTVKPNRNWLQEYIHPDDQPHVKTVINEAIRTKGIFELVHRVLRVDGTLGWTFSRAIPVLDANGKIVEWFGAASDITERKTAEEALKQLNEELENRVAERTAELIANTEKLRIETVERMQAVEALREKEQMLIQQGRQAAMGEMIGNIAHQWRQPLNTLGLTIQQLSLYHDLGEFTKEFLKNSVDKSMQLIQHMSKTIDDFRNFFRPDKEKVEFELSEAITSTLSLIEDGFKNEHIRIKFIAKSEPVIIGYRNEYAQVVLNILNNARDIFKERNIKDPKVSITIFTEHGRAVVTISDNAGGIPQEIIGKIFDPYFTTKGPQQGTGVGLFMSKTIIESNMGGRLSVRNHGNGAEFRIEV